MKMATTPEVDGEMEADYDQLQLRGGVRGKYFESYKSRLPLVRLDADVAEAFPTAEAVDSALRLQAELARRKSPIAPVAP